MFSSLLRAGTGFCKERGMRFLRAETALKGQSQLVGTQRHTESISEQEYNLHCY